jgi:hypothetical protein
MTMRDGLSVAGATAIAALSLAMLVASPTKVQAQDCRQIGAYIGASCAGAYPPEWCIACVIQNCTSHLGNGTCSDECQNEGVNYC